MTMNRAIVLQIAALVIVGALSFGVNAALSDTKAITLSLVNQDPDPAVAGDILELRIGIENRGGETANNFIIEIEPAYPFSMLSGESASQNLGNIYAYQYDEDVKVVKFKLRVDREATAGQYGLDVRVHEQGTAATSSKTLSIDIENKESAEVIYIDQVELIPGKITPLQFTVNNVGSSPLRDLTFQWENADDIVLPVGSDNTKYIKYIDVGESAKVKFDVIASATAEPNLYKLDLTLSYDDPATGDAAEINTKAGVYVGGATDFDATFSGVDSGEASFSIPNIGSVSASSVTVRVPEQEGWRVTGSNAVIIGNLNKGDYTIASFTIRQATTAARAASGGNGDAGARQDGSGSSSSGGIPSEGETNTLSQRFRQQQQSSAIRLDIEYTDSRGNRNTVTKEVQLDPEAFISTGTAGTGTASLANGRNGFSRRQGFWQTWKAPVIVAAIIVLLFLAQREYKKRRMKDHGYTYGRLVRDCLAKLKIGKKKL